ncbi:hypothetical protein GGR44_000643 [Sphingobium fontiphilum]|uniref:DUF2093 domain-containing protein n=1 Tax=Sphingobium fontiphilum TaxID=944425 RepID=A0A7W6DI54_9SPHN|nr:DUF2093 domain-containing protein [Sphingobium fontiphilum]MBB3981012.1 hypothetical protein [Sphingobium fontiphilum]
MAADIPGLAKIRYGTPHFEVIKPGQFVLCAVSGERIDLDILTYWSEALQEAYRGAPEATQAMLRHRDADEA